MRTGSTKGFTLIELLIVIAIIGILAAVLIPNLLDARTAAFNAGAQSCANSVQTAQEIEFINNDAYSAAPSGLSGLAAACDDVTWANEGLTGGGDGWTADITHNNGDVTYTVTESSITP